MSEREKFYAPVAILLGIMIVLGAVLVVMSHDVPNKKTTVAIYSANGSVPELGCQEVPG